MANGIINEFKQCKRCRCNLLQESIYSYEGYCHYCYPLCNDSEEEFEIKCFNCLYYLWSNRWCNSPLGEYKPVYWKGSPCLFIPNCKFYRKKRRNL